jgi:hypothetical protein
MIAWPARIDSQLTNSHFSRSLPGVGLSKISGSTRPWSFSWSANQLCSDKDVLRGLFHLNDLMVIEIYPSKGATAVAVASQVSDPVDVDELLYIVGPC